MEKETDISLDAHALWRSLSTCTLHGLNGGNDVGQGLNLSLAIGAVLVDLRGQWPVAFNRLGGHPSKQLMRCKV